MCQFQHTEYDGTQDLPGHLKKVMTDKHNKFPRTRIICAAGACMLLAGCAGQTWIKPAIPPLQNQPSHKIADVDILGVSTAMAQFVERHIPSDTKRSDKAFSLTYATLDRNFFDFEYDPSLTLTAEDAFRQKTGNCLTFSSMFIAMAREAGLNAWYQEVEIPKKWSNVNETLLISRHVNAVVQDAKMEYVVDVSRNDRGEVEWRRRISDKEALSQCYNTLGADALIENQLATAYAYFAKAIETNPNAAYIWSNLGVVYRRNGQAEDAEAIYLSALELEPGEAVALNNLYTIYVEQGNEEAALAVQSQVEKHRRKNPYYLHHLSVTAVNEQRYRDANRLLKRAIKIDESEYRFHVTLARSLYLSGARDEARLSLDRAKELAPPSAKLDVVSLAELINTPDI
jgi:Flp pilus assembly protein TadD